MITPNSELIGIDGSNWQREITDADIAKASADGIQYGIFRLSLETPGKRALSVQQCNAFRAAGLPVMGYAWAYWSDTRGLTMPQYADLAAECGVDIIAVDIEDPVTIPGQTVPWLQRAIATLTGRGILPIMYTYSTWPGSNRVDLSPLGDVRWWIGNENFTPNLYDYAIYPGADVVGHQYGTWTDADGDTFDLNVFRFDAEMAARLNAQIGVKMTEDQVRAIVAEELDKIAAACGTPAGFSLLMQAIVARIAAAGAALDLTRPVPNLPSANG